MLQKLKAYSATIITLTDQAIVSGGNFVINIILARALGVDDYGIYALLWMVLLFGLSFSQAFITKPLLSLGPKKDGLEQKQYLGTVHTLQLLFSIVSAVLIFGFLLLGELVNITVPDRTIYIVLPILIGFHLIYDFYRKMCFVNQSVERALVMDGIMYILQFGSIVYLWQTDQLTILTALLAISAAHIIAVIVGFIFIKNINFNAASLKSAVLEHWKFSKWLVGTSALQWLSGNFFIIAAAAVLNTAAVGAVRIVQNVMGLTHVLFLAMENVVPVKAALHYKEGGWKQLRTYLFYITKRAGLVVGGILLLVAIFAEWIIGALYGQEILQNTDQIGLTYQWIVIGFCLTYVLVFISHPYRFALRTLEITQPIFVAYVIGAAFSLIASYPMLEYFGMVGLLAGLFITQLLSQVVYNVYLARNREKYEV